MLQAASCIGPEFDLMSVAHRGGWSGRRRCWRPARRTARRAHRAARRCLPVCVQRRARHQSPVRVPPRPRAADGTRIDGAAGPCRNARRGGAPPSGARGGDPRGGSRNSPSTSQATTQRESTPSSTLPSGSMPPPGWSPAPRGQSGDGHGDCAGVPRAGRPLLPADRWAVVPDLARRLHTEAADIAYIEGRFSDIDRHAAAVLAHTTDPLQRMPIHNIHIGIGVAQNRWGEATEYAIDVLADEYGIDLPLRPSLANGRARDREDAVAAAQLLDRRPPRAPTDARRARRRVDVAVDEDGHERVLGVAQPGAADRADDGARSRSATATAGCRRTATCSTASCCQPCCSRRSAGYRYGELAMDVLDRYGARHLVGKTALVHHGFIRHGVDPMATCGRSRARRLPRSARGGRHRERCLLRDGRRCTPPSSPESRCPALAERLATVRRGRRCERARADDLRHVGVGAGGRQPAGGSRRAGAAWRAHRLRAAPGGAAGRGGRQRDPAGRVRRRVPRVPARRRDRAERHLGLLFSNMRNTPGQAYLMPCLGCTRSCSPASGRQGERAGADRPKLVAITRLLERRAKANPGDHRPFLDFIAAERAAGAGRPTPRPRFLDAAGPPRRAGSRIWRASRSERAAALHEARGHSETARHLMGRAVAVWQRYGATARLRLLGLDPDAPTPDGRLVDRRRHAARHRRRRLARLEVDARRRPRCCSLAVENAGARPGHAVLAARRASSPHGPPPRSADDGTFDCGARVARPTPVDEQRRSGWPCACVDYVARTGDRPGRSPTPPPTRASSATPTSVSHGVRSVLCAPLHRAGELVGVLYLENSLGPDIFTVRAPDDHPHDRRAGRDRHRERRPLRAAAGDGHRIQPVRPAPVPRAPRTRQRGARCSSATPWPPT